MKSTINKPDEKVFGQIKKVLKFVWNNPYSSFYKTKFKKAGISGIAIKDFEKFAKLPYLTKSEIINTNPWDRLFIPRKKVDGVGISSGTSGTIYPMIYFSRANRSKLEKTNLRFAKELDAKVWMFIWSNLSSSYHMQREEYTREEGVVRLAGDISNLPVSAKIAAVTRVDTILTSPTILSFFIPHLKKEYDPGKIKLIILGGEICSEERAKFLRKTFKNALIKFQYGAIESRLIGYKCDYLDKLPPSYYHPMPSLYCEVDGEGGRGELIITHRHTDTSFPLIRYRTGDMVIMEDRNCPCGIKKTMQVFGRLEHEVLKVQGTTIYAQKVEKAIQSLTGYLQSTDFQLHLYEKNKNGKFMVLLKLQLVAKPSSPVDLIKDLFSKNLYLSAQFTLEDLVKKWVFLPLEVEFVKPFPLAIKAKRLVSHIN